MHCTGFTTLLLNLKIFNKEKGWGNISWLSSSYSCGSQKIEMLKGHLDNACALGLTCLYLTGQASSK